MDATFKVGDLPAAKGFVNIGDTYIAGAAIVRCEDDDGIFIQPIGFEGQVPGLRFGLTI